MPDSPSSNPNERSLPPTAGQSSSTEDVVASAVSGVSALFVVQIVIRLFTFIMNTIIARSVQLEEFGVATVQLELLLQMVMTFAREGVRSSTLRASTPEAKSAALRTAINSYYWSAAVCVCVPASFFVFSDAKAFPGTLGLYTVACLLELSIEPLFIVNQNDLKYGLRAAIEGVGAVMRVFVVLITSFAGMNGVTAFGIGQLTFALVSFAGYFVFAFEDAKKHWSSTKQSHETNKQAQNHTAFWFVVQSVEKFFLGHVETVVLLGLFTAKQWGVFGLVNNLGSLMARLAFAPVEESARITFGKLKSTRNNQKNTSSDSKEKAGRNGTKAKSCEVDKTDASWTVVDREGENHGHTKEKNDASGQQKQNERSADDNSAAKVKTDSKNDLKENEDKRIFTDEDDDDYLFFPAFNPPSGNQEATAAWNVLRGFGTATSTIGMLAGLYTLFAAPEIVDLLYGKNWSESEAPHLLRLQGITILLLPINGISEAFVQAVAEGQTLKRWNVMLAVLSGINIGLSFLLCTEQPFGLGFNLGLYGLSLSSSCVFVVRIAFNCTFIASTFGCSTIQVLSAMLVSGRSTLVTFVLGYCAMVCNEYFHLMNQHPQFNYNDSTAANFARFFLAGVLSALAVLLTEKDALSLLLSMLRGSKRSDKARINKQD